jgi:hypothetical protein
MLAVTHAEAVLKGREVIVAIIGGTMLTLALTRPRLRWAERLTDGSDTARVWSERGLTLFSLAMAGYAFITVSAALHKQLDWESDALLRGATYFLFGYAWLVHFEPFVREWQLRGGLGAGILYSSIMFATIGFGGVLAEVAASSSISSSAIALMAILGGFVIVGWITYRLLPRFERAADHAIDRGFARLGISPKPPAVEKGEPAKP